MKKIILLSFVLLFSGYFTFSQEKSKASSLEHLLKSPKAALNWQNLDPEVDKVMGVSTERAYSELLKNKKAKKEIIVAVIDGGVDIYHEDLKGQIWINTDEIPNNGIDDDKNGYVDDIHGWNFLGNLKGEHTWYTHTERTRFIRKYRDKFKNIKSINELSPKDTSAYKTYKSCLETHNERLRRLEKKKKEIELAKAKFIKSKKVLSRYLSYDSICKKELLAINTKNKKKNLAKTFLLEQYKRGYRDTERYDKVLKRKVQSNLDYYLNLDYNDRKLIGDDDNDFTDINYGNNKVDGDGYGCGHGTFVAGLIAANRNNGIGINGIATSVKIMALRVVPEADENDKDVALAIKYAIDNGADIINMSFGKSKSANKWMVDKVLSYAKNKNVLLIKASGNASSNTDKYTFYPDNKLDNGETINNWLSIGASSKNNDEYLAAGFSNYGKKTVDVFAPGVRVISTYPQSTYDNESGTSFACPITSGVAALVWSYYPELTAMELKEVLLKSSIKYTTEVVIPDRRRTKEKTAFNNLSITGGIVNVYKALQLAEKKNRR